jgi:hypothetical protein
MSSRQPQDQASESTPSPPHQPAYPQGFASINAPTTLRQPTPSGWASTSMSSPVSGRKVVLTIAHYYNISHLHREQGPHRRLYQVPIQSSSGNRVISSSRYLSKLLKAIQENAPGMGCGPESSKIIYFVTRTNHEQRAPAFRSILSLHPMILAACPRVVTLVGLTYPWAALRQIGI